MKFLYVDESGGPGVGDVFVMCGVMVDAYKIRSKTQKFDAMLQAMLSRHPGKGTELKTSKCLNGKGGWSRVPHEERKQFVRSVCELAVDGGGRLFGIGLSIGAFSGERAERVDGPTGIGPWLAAAMFIATLVQKKMQKEQRNKGLTVVVMDDNKQGMPALADGIHEAEEWFDGLYQIRKTYRGQRRWRARTSEDRFDQIVNTPFAIKSQHSSLVQVADVLAYVYRRELELRSEEVTWPGERAYYAELVGVLEPKRAKLGQRPRDAKCVQFYESATHPGWEL